jgi:dihydrofolate reductase
MSVHVFAIAIVTANGFIAAHEDQRSLEWTSKEDTRFFVKKTKEAGIVIMGATTFATFQRALPGRRLIVYTNHPERITAEGVETTTEPPARLLSRLEQEGASSVAIAGGTTIYRMFLEAGLLNELYLSIGPILFGHGVPLIGQTDQTTGRLQLVDMTHLNDDTLLLHYSISTK